MDYQIEKLEEYRTRKRFSLFPFIIVNVFNDEYFWNHFIWTGKWFKSVEITQQRFRERWTEFDDGWSYQDYWVNWRYGWRFIKINTNG